MNRRLTLLLILMWTPSAVAYVPPADYVLEQWIRHVRRAKSLHVRQVTTSIDASRSEGHVEIREEIWIEPPLRYRRDTHDSQGTIHEVVLPDQSLRIVSGRVERRPPLEVLGPLGVLWVADSKDRLTSLLMQLRISLDEVRWALHEGEVVFEIGAKDGSRIRFERNAWRPVGAFWSGMEYRFEHSRSGEASAAYPQIVEVTRNGKTLWRSETKHLSSGNPLKKSVFDLQTLRSKGETQ